MTIFFGIFQKCSNFPKHSGAFTPHQGIARDRRTLHTPRCPLLPSSSARPAAALRDKAQCSMCSDFRGPTRLSKTDSLVLSAPLPSESSPPRSCQPFWASRQPKMVFLYCGTGSTFAVSAYRGSCLSRLKWIGLDVKCCNQEQPFKYMTLFSQADVLRRATY